MWALNHSSDKLILQFGLWPSDQARQVVCSPLTLLAVSRHHIHKVAILLRKIAMLRRSSTSGTLDLKPLIGSLQNSRFITQRLSSSHYIYWLRINSTCDVNNLLIHFTGCCKQSTRHLCKRLREPEVQVVGPPIDDDGSQAVRETMEDLQDQRKHYESLKHSHRPHPPRPSMCVMESLGTRLYRGFLPVYV